MQTDKELEALDIDYDELYYHMLERGAVPSRIPIDPMNEYHQVGCFVGGPSGVRGAARWCTCREKGNSPGGGTFAPALIAG